MFKAVSLGLMNILRLITVLWLVAHFALTLIYVLPTTPIRPIIEPIIDVAIEKFFVQGWDLFGPDPTDTNYALLVKPMTNQELQIARIKKKLANDGWYDLSSPLWEKQSNPLSAYPRLANIVTEAAKSYDQDPDTESLKVLLKFASAFCKDIGKTNASYVALTIREQHSVQWPDGAPPNPPVTTIKYIGIYWIDTTVEQIHLYQL